MSLLERSNLVWCYSNLFHGVGMTRKWHRWNTSCSESCLSSPTVHWLQDPRSRVYNFTPHLQEIPSIDEFDFDRVTGFIPSSQHSESRRLAVKHGKLFTGSTSSMTGILSQIYFAVSGGREVDISPLSMEFAGFSKTFTHGSKIPAYVNLRHKDGIYALDGEGTTNPADKEATLLSWMGIMLEKMLTMSESSFKSLYHSQPRQDLERLPEAYQYSKTSRFILRSQLDCIDPRIGGTGVFDIKTRAAVSIRKDQQNHEFGSGYLIKNLTGRWESFEREYYDLICSAFLKYSFQARIGSMEGIFLAYHNTKQIFGFQFVSLDEMDARLFGGRVGGDRAFKMVLGLAEEVLMRITKECWPGKSMRCMVEYQADVLHFYVEPDEWNTVKHGRRPAVQYDVKIENFVNGLPVKGPFDFNDPTVAWTLMYQVTRYEPCRQTRTNMDMSRVRRELITKSLHVDGLDKTSVGKYQYDGPSEEDKRRHREDKRMIKLLSREGRRESMRNQKMHGLKEKVVLDSPPVYSEGMDLEEQAVSASTVAQPRGASKKATKEGAAPSRKASSTAPPPSPPVVPSPPPVPSSPSPTTPTPPTPPTLPSPEASTMSPPPPPSDSESAASTLAPPPAPSPSPRPSTSRPPRPPPPSFPPPPPPPAPPLPRRTPLRDRDPPLSRIMQLYNWVRELGGR
ncbi:hypothetical protein BOTBODRAFT_321101 [Botryobasidium botryosum FD-172 SS1]|uniref:Pet127-domain-containing protein n=1 Tax=Botryobasidium botryosum (strain FD-172 SS1) TaxID=930990 RepID=A0A067MZ56_BOTB1|nr:hypothetical protein BOTBODRAFT_321101 [Botryobasidium botryosum FD-172 SS1]